MVKLFDRVIQHWTEIVEYCEEHLYQEYLGPHYDTKECAFCLEYHKDRCLGCPIYVDTGVRGCFGTPYEYFFMGLDNEDSRVITEETLFWAKKELEYLKKLRKKYETS